MSGSPVSAASCLKRPRQPHPSAITSQDSVRYSVRMLTAALADPAVSSQVTRFGGMLPDRSGDEIDPIELKRGLNERHPDTGQRMRRRVNGATRIVGGVEVNNRLRGWDVTFALDKSLSIAALLFEDQDVMDLGYQALHRAGRQVGRKIQRRVRKGGANHELHTGVGIGFTVPEKASRYGEPHLHLHNIFCNVTEYEEAEKTVRCAAQFQQVAASAGEAYRQANVWLHRQLVKRNYVVELAKGRTCRLVAVPRYFCRELSQAAKVIEGEANEAGLQMAPGLTSVADIRLKRNAYRKCRPKKVLKPLADWQAVWTERIGPEELAGLRNSYYQDRFYPEKSAPVVSPDLVAADEGAIAAIQPAVVGGLGSQIRADQKSTAANADEAEDPFLSFRSLAGAFRSRLENECPEPVAWEQMEVIQNYPSRAMQPGPEVPHEAELVWKIFHALMPRLRIRQVPRDAVQPRLGFSNQGAGPEGLGKIIQEMGEAFHAEFLQLLKTESINSIIGKISREMPVWLTAQEPVAAILPRPVERGSGDLTIPAPGPDRGTPAITTPATPMPETEVWEMSL